MTKKNNKRCKRMHSNNSDENKNNNSNDSNNNNENNNNNNNNISININNKSDVNENEVKNDDNKNSNAGVFDEEENWYCFDHSNQIKAKKQSTIEKTNNDEIKNIDANKLDQKQEKVEDTVDNETHAEKIEKERILNIIANKNELQKFLIQSCKTCQISFLPISRFDGNNLKIIKDKKNFKHCGAHSSAFQTKSLIVEKKEEKLENNIENDLNGKEDNRSDLILNEKNVKKTDLLEKFSLEKSNNKKLDSNSSKNKQFRMGIIIIFIVIINIIIILLLLRLLLLLLLLF
jgi:hypothetical protein